MDWTRKVNPVRRKKVHEITRIPLMVNKRAKYEDNHNGTVFCSFSRSNHVRLRRDQDLQIQMPKM